MRVLRCYLRIVWVWRQLLVFVCHVCCPVFVCLSSGHPAVCRPEVLRLSVNEKQIQELAAQPTTATKKRAATTAAAAAGVTATTAPAATSPAAAAALRAQTPSSPRSSATL